MKRRYMVIGIVLIAVVGMGYLAWQLTMSEWSDSLTIHNTPDSIKSAVLMPSDDSNPSPYYEVVYIDGNKKGQLTPQDYAKELLNKNDSRSFTYKLLNISTPFGIAWVSLGLLGQVLFTGRMIVQWLASEKSKRSVVPTSFWWMSLIGASMLITYFIWRKDIVGFIGQGAGWMIYGRNLWLIYHSKPEQDTDS
jgi:lipid-A-disaccharide synthase-like uncharacterized protein